MSVSHSACAAVELRLDDFGWHPALPGLKRSYCWLASGWGGRSASRFIIIRGDHRSYCRAHSRSEFLRRYHPHRNRRCQLVLASGCADRGLYRQRGIAPRHCVSGRLCGFVPQFDSGGHPYLGESRKAQLCSMRIRANNRKGLYSSARKIWKECAKTGKYFENSARRAFRFDKLQFTD